jgi:hypothetical protein
VRKKYRLRDLSKEPSEGPTPPDEKPATEWSRFKVGKGVIEGEAEGVTVGQLVIQANDRAGGSLLFGALIRKPDLTIKTTAGDRQIYGIIKRLVVTHGKKADTVNFVATVRTSSDIKEFIGRSVEVETRQADLPLEKETEASE